MEDKWLIVYQGHITEYRIDYKKDEYKNKLVLVTGNKDSVVMSVRDSYLCVSDGTTSIEIPIPATYLQKIKIGENGTEYGKVDGILQFAQANGVNISFTNGAVTIGIDNETLAKINSIDNKVGKDDLKSLTYTVNGVSQTFNGLSEATIPQIFTPTQVGSQGQVLQSMGDGAPQWANLSDIKGAVGFAKDLTGVQEATAEEFTFRPSAGFRSIRDESAVIRRIKGNTSVWAQHVKNGDFAEGTRYFAMVNSTLSDNGDGSITITHKANTSCGVSTIFDTHIPSGHKILAVVDYQRDSDKSSRTFLYLRRNGGGFDSRIISGIADARRRVDFAIITATDDITGFYFYPFFDSPAGTQCVVYSMSVYDLTTIYGAGNEPTTLDEFRELYPDSYYPYCVPEVRSMRATGIETIGFNAFNGEYAEVLGGLRYCISSNITRLGFSETIGGGIATIPIPEDGMYTPSRRGFLYAIGSDICIHLVHSGVCNGEHHDYERNVRLLPDIATYFPDGMHGIGGVFDEINEENAVKKFGVVDLGTLEWTEYTLNKLQYWWATIGDIKMLGIEYFPNMTCSKLSAQTLSNVFTGKFDNSIAPHNSLPRVYARSSAYTDAASFKAAMSGVMLVYEIFEPVVTPITEPLQLDYKVADFGTEKMLSDLPSSPFRADIVYQFNAEGRIRDNSRNIERLEDKVKNMATIEDIPTEIATATQRKVMWSEEAVLSLLPNILYDYSLGSLGSLALPSLSTGNLAYDDVWMVRVALTSSESLTIPFDVLWRDGIAPSFDEWCTIDLTFRKNANGERILGEWKIYR